MTVVAAETAAQRVSVVATYSRTVLGATGLVMLGFVLLHLAGNLLAFVGSGTFNAYARSIRELGAPLVGEGSLLAAARVILATALVLHVVAHLVVQRWPSEAPRYALVPPWYATLPLSVLQASGGVIALFLVLHLAQLTVGVAQPAFVIDDPYHNLVATLRFWPTAAAYLIAAAAVGVHLLAGTWTGMRSLGLVNARTGGLARKVAPIVAIAVTAGLSSLPVAVLVGVVR